MQNEQIHPRVAEGTRQRLEDMAKRLEIKGVGSSGLGPIITAFSLIPEELWPALQLFLDAALDSAGDNHL